MNKYLIIGSATHGKTEFASILSNLHSLRFKDSSVAAAEIFIYDILKNAHGYNSPEECYLDRVNHRAEWYNLICEYNKLDKARLAKEILKDNDIYVGMRDNAEIEECQRQRIFDLVIGVYDPRKPQESSTSFNINIWEKSDIVIPNSGILQELRARALKLKL